MLKVITSMEVRVPGLRVGGPGAELIVGACQPSAGRFGASTEIILADQVLQVFQKVHILPYKAPERNPCFKYENYMHTNRGQYKIIQKMLQHATANNYMT